MNRGYLGRHFHCFYPFYARLAQIITRFLQNESLVSPFVPTSVPAPSMGEGRRYFALVELHQSKCTGRGCTKKLTAASFSLKAGIP